MGLQIGDIVPRREVKLEDLKGKVIAVDAFNALYQFLSSVRQPDGTPLMDSKGRVTSHLSGLFYRNIALLDEASNWPMCLMESIMSLRERHMKSEMLLRM